MIKRYLESHIVEDLKEKMVFISGPRQVGKTTLSKDIGKEYYKDAFQANWGKNSFHSSHLYQLNTYLDCSERTRNSGQKIDGILLYPATNDEFEYKFGVRNHTITIAAIDMRKDSKEISQRMLDILQ